MVAAAELAQDTAGVGFVDRFQHRTAINPTDGIRGKHDPKSDKAVPESEPKADKADGKPRRVSAKSAICAKDPIEMIRGPEIEKFELTRCDGTIAPLAVEHLSILIRPGSAARPIAPSLRYTSASTVGLPRESKISRPIVFTMCVKNLLL